MIKKLIVSLIALIVLTGNFVYALDFSHSASIENKGDRKYKAVRLDAEVYNNIRQNMADVAIYDNNNEPVPFFINSYTEVGKEEKRTYEMTLINSYVKDEDFYYDYGLVNPQDEDVIATSIEIETGMEGFAKEVEVLGSYDNVRWEKVKDDILYSVGGNKKPGIYFNSIKKYPFYRFRISNNLEKISFASVELKYNKVLMERAYFSSTISPEYTVEEKERKTVIKVPEFKNLKLLSVTLKTDSMFKRNVTFDNRVSKMLYNLDFENTRYQDLTLQLDNYRVGYGISEIVIDNQDDKPVNIQGIEAEYLVDELIFEGSKQENYALKFGNVVMSIPKSYDISNYKEQILNEGYDILSVKDIKEEYIVSDEDSQPPYDYKLIFNITITAVAVIMGVILFLKLKK
jgi:hypothetical protein